MAYGWRAVDRDSDMNTALYWNGHQASQPRFAIGFSDSATDEVLVAAAKMGEERVFETLVRSALELRELRELSARETAQHTGLSVAAVKARVFHGRKKLRKHIRIVGSRGVSKRAFQQPGVASA